MSAPFGVDLRYWMRQNWLSPHSTKERAQWSWRDERETMRRVRLALGDSGVRRYVAAQTRRTVGFDGELVGSVWRERLRYHAQEVLADPTAASGPTVVQQ